MARVVKKKVRRKVRRRLSDVNTCRVQTRKSLQFLGDPDCKSREVDGRWPSADEIFWRHGENKTKAVGFKSNTILPLCHGGGSTTDPNVRLKRQAGRTEEVFICAEVGYQQGFISSYEAQVCSPQSAGHAQPGQEGRDKTHYCPSPLHDGIHNTELLIIGPRRHRHLLRAPDQNYHYHYHSELLVEKIPLLQCLSRDQHPSPRDGGNAPER
ncbi:uncharacterized protein LOC133514148 [Syngnathoides biaculeatus]|uniref:uncharacterized protein LOC133514148 n=1 Tax=Syngnathoides biaculeatus TaxID=300417 RepID=UPI002ADDAC2C|nr:uncharacterized protein LOC133514148 [Syngnathoides biaculeatus]